MSSLLAAKEVIQKGIIALRQRANATLPQEVIGVPTQIKEGTGAIWISSTYPVGRFLDALRLFSRITGREALFHFKQHKSIEDSFDELQFPGIRQIIPCFKEGGVYVTFGSKDQAKQVLNELGNNVTIKGEKKKAFLVQGKPFIEDLSHSHPSFKLNVELVDVAKVTQRLSAEMIYNEMRGYGKMQDITVDAKKETAAVQFANRSAAISARNCLHLKAIGDTKFYIRYEPYSRLHILIENLKNPRFLIPLLGILITISTYLLVDPIRVTSVTQKVTRGHKDDQLSSSHVLERIEASKVREDTIADLKKRLRTRPDGVLVITGPSGSGKTMLVNRVIHRRAFTVRIPCKGNKNILEFVENLGDSIGFSPSFNTLNTILNWLESFIPGLKKTALSPSMISQLESILHTLDNVVYLISAGYPSEKGREWDYPVIVFDGFHELIENLESTTDKAEKEKAKDLMNVLFTWALRTSTTAHVVFVGENPYGEELILQHPIMKKVKVANMTLEDLSHDEMTSYLSHNLEKQISEHEIEYALAKVGGRVSDLLNLAARVNAGSEMRVAVDGMVFETEQHLRNEGFGGSLTSTTKKWNQVQLWKTIKQIATKGSVPYDDLLFKVFSGNNDALKSLIEEDLLAIHKESDGRKVTAFSALHMSVFKKMLDTPKLRLALDIQEKKADLKKDLDEVASIEEEYIKLQKAESGRSPIHSFVARRQFLERNWLS